MSEFRSGKLSRRAVLRAGAAIGAIPLFKVSRGFAEEPVGNFRPA